MSDKFKYYDFAKFDAKDVVFPKSAGIFQTETIRINDNIMLYRNNFSVKEDISFQYDFIFNGITINIPLEASFSYKSILSDFEMSLQKNRTLLTFVREEKGEIIHKKNSVAKTLLIFIKLDFFKDIMREEKSVEDILKHIEDIEYSKILKSRTTNAKTKLCANEIYNCKNTTSLDLMFIESKVMEIIVYEFKDLIIDNGKITQNDIKFNAQDIESLHLAKEILARRFKNPPTITELSKLIALNEFKLKYGFKKLFNTTPYQSTIEYKMNEAKIMLQSRDYNVDEVALELGYKQTHGFSNAFFKKFHIRPKEFMKRNVSIY